MRRKILKVLLVLAAVVLLVFLSGVIYLTVGDLSVYRDDVAEMLSETLGREFVIAGEFQVDFSMSPRLAATDIRLKNADWGAEPSMVHVDRFEVGVDLWSLVSGPIQVHDLRIDGARIVLEDPGDGHDPNWVFGESADEPTGEPTGALMFDGIEIENVVLEYRDTVLARPLVLAIVRLAARSEEDGRLDLQLEGALNDAPLNASGLIGPMNHLIDMVDVRQNIEVRLGQTEISLEGAVADLSTLEGPDVRLDVHGTDIEHLTGLLGLPALGSGPFGVEGSVTTSARGVELELDASLGGLSADVEGFVSALLDPVELDVAVAAACPDLGAIASLFKFDGFPTEPLDVSGHVQRHDEKFAFEEFEVKLGQVALTAHGVLGELPSMVDTDFTLMAAGPALSSFSELAGVDLPAEPFRIDARLLARDDGISVENCLASLGKNSLRVSGIVGEPPDLFGTNLQLHAGGPGLSSFESLAGVELPAVSWEVSGPVRVDPKGYELEGIELRIGDTLMKVGGRVGPPPEWGGTDVTARIVGSDLSQLSATAGSDLPGEAFTVEGRVRSAGAGFALEGIVATLAGVVLEADGRLGAPPDLDGSDVTVAVRGADLSRVAALARIDQDLPAEAFEVRGRVRVDGSGYPLEGFVATLADITIGIDGRVEAAPGLAGSTLRVTVEGSELSRVGSMAGIDDLPAERYSVAARVGALEDGYGLEEVVARIGQVDIEASGRVGAAPDLEGTDVEFQVRGPDLSALQAYPEVPPLPAEPFSVTGRVRIVESLYHLERVVADLVGNRVTIEGAVGPMPEMTATDLGFDVSVPNLDALGRMMTVAGLAEIPELPAKPLSATGRFGVREGGYELKGIAARYGASTFSVDGVVGAPPELRGTDLRVEVRAQDGSLVGALAGLDLPAEPLRISGRVGRLDEWAQFDAFAIDLGEYHVEVEGSVGEPPELIGTDLRLLARGPSLALVSRIAELPPLPEEPFEVSGQFEGNPERFKMEQFVARLGDSDVRGKFRVDLEDKPAATGEFSSDHVDLTMFLGLGEDDTEPDEANEPATESKLLIPDDPIDLEVLQSVNARVSWTAQNVITPEAQYSDFQIGVKLQDGKLRVDPVVGVGQWGGGVNASFALDTLDGEHHVEAHLTGDDWRIALPGSQVKPEDMPSTNVELHIEARGRTLHEIAGSADGGLGLARGAGITDNNTLDLLGGDVLFEILSVLNPFAKQQKYTQLECTVLFIELENGVATFDPVAMRTDKMTLLGKGMIDLGTEKLHLDWKTKSRRGLGVGAGSLINPFVNLGGTLAKPRISFDSVQAAKTTGMAAATVGLSILGEGLWNRFSAGKKVCGKVLEDARGRMELTRPRTDED